MTGCFEPLCEVYEQVQCKYLQTTVVNAARAVKQADPQFPYIHRSEQWHSRGLFKF